MGKLILIDTDVLIDIGRKINLAIASLKRVEEEAVPGISIITQMELMIGCRNKKEICILEDFLQHFEIIGLNETIGNKSVELLRQYRLSHSLLIADALIAATSLTINSPLLTKNQKDYQFIKGLEILSYPYY
ncbi:MAG: type II toxin-antitoxin system VapC family toxin [Nitrospinae bacterium]|nr:type II toxin-antitoxin system VapC family toxin [Nitrospinota bacterium]